MEELLGTWIAPYASQGRTVPPLRVSAFLAFKLALRRPSLVLTPFVLFTLVLVSTGLITKACYNTFFKDFNFLGALPSGLSSRIQFSLGSILGNSKNLR
jgi:hypothetical protein